MDNWPSGLRFRRLAAGKSAEDCAQLIGVTVNTYYRFEKGTRRLYYDKACLLADFLECSVEKFRIGPSRENAEQLADGTTKVGAGDVLGEEWVVDD